MTRNFPAMSFELPVFRHLVFSIAIVVGIDGQLALGYTSKSPEVQRMIRRGIEFIESDNGRGKFSSDNYGAACLRALTIYKHHKNPDHKMVKAGIDAVLKEVARGAEVGRTDKVGLFDKSNYSNAMGVMLLCEIDPVKYRAEIRSLIDVLYARQFDRGGWGYLNYESDGDTSQVQYVLLALWTAHNKQIPIEYERVARAVNWLMRTQDPSGIWGYQGKDPGSLKLILQTDTRHPMGLAGLGTVYLGADLLGLTRKNRGLRGEGGAAELPPALKLTDDRAVDRIDRKKLINSSDLERTMKLGDRWWLEDRKIEVPQWNFYYLYALERYQSFREKYLDLRFAKADWYDRGVEFLKKKQDKDGGWSGNFSGRDLQTCLAVLFLMRNTKTILENYEEVLVGDRFDSRAGELRTGRDGRLTTTPVSQTLGELLDELDKKQAEAELEFILGPGNVILHEDDPKTRREQLAKLRGLVTHKKYKLRRFVVDQLGQSRDLDNVPALIYALTDPDVVIQRKAQEGLKHISRKFEGFGLKFETAPKKTKLEQAAAMWKDWYLSIRPGSETDFFD